MLALLRPAKKTAWVEELGRRSAGGNTRARMMGDSFCERRHRDPLRSVRWPGLGSPSQIGDGMVSELTDHALLVGAVLAMPDG